MNNLPPNNSQSNAPQFTSYSLPLMKRVYPELINMDSNIDPKYKFDYFMGDVSKLHLHSTIVKSEFSIWSIDKLTRFEETQKLSAYDAEDFWVISFNKKWYKIPSHHLEVSEDGNIIESHTEELKSNFNVVPMSEPSGLTFAMRYVYGGDEKKS